jgi:predicted N-acetyltransferase YhbS
MTFVNPVNDKVAEPIQITFSPATAGDADDLASLRVLAMKESLQRIGRFDEYRARERFLSSYNPSDTQHILADGVKIGFIVMKLREHDFLLDHLYVKPEFQGKGIGSEVVRRALADAHLANKPIRVGALRNSDSNRFYSRHGFQLEREGEWDFYYVAMPNRA